MPDGPVFFRNLLARAIVAVPRSGIDPERASHMRLPRVPKGYSFASMQTDTRRFPFSSALLRHNLKVRHRIYIPFKGWWPLPVAAHLPGKY